MELRNTPPSNSVRNKYAELQEALEDNIGLWAQYPTMMKNKSSSYVIASNIRRNKYGWQNRKMKYEATSYLNDSGMCEVWLRIVE